ncbi:MAG: cytidine deaminase [Ruminococcaceae bacterium]|nr:cytidine deaminase [Oscillospiraceae bacterium]
MKNSELIDIAIGAMKSSYAPYSKYNVGAAILTKSGKVYTGCNIENASYSATNCAERTAIFKAVSDGEKGFRKIAIVGGKNGEITNYAPPCGICRQVLAEFCDNDFIVITAKSSEEYIEYTLEELLPNNFKLKI